jgi:hypothetical protein
MTHRHTRARRKRHMPEFCYILTFRPPRMRRRERDPRSPLSPAGEPVTGRQHTLARQQAGRIRHHIIRADLRARSSTAAGPAMSLQKREDA